MKKSGIRESILAVGIFVSSLACEDSARGEDPSELWIVSGQSNACGRAELPGPAGLAAVTVHDPDAGEWIVARDPLPGMGTTGVGPWVFAAQRVARSGRSVRLVGYAKGGRPISHWFPGQEGGDALMPRIERAARGAGVFLWYQGESDAYDEDRRRQYASELASLVARVRKQADNPDMLAVIVQLGPWTGADRPASYASIRESQRRFVIEDGNALLVPALGRTLKDSVHLDRAGYAELGEEIGRALLRRRSGEAGGNWPGPVLDAAVLSATGERIVAHFAEVKRLGGCQAADFGALDSRGPVKCVRSEPGETVVRLTFERKIALPAKLIYGVGNAPAATLVDEAGNRASAVELTVTEGDPPKDAPTQCPDGAGTRL